MDDARSGQFEALYLESYPGLLRRVGRRLGCHAIASDLIHDVFLRLWERAPRSIDDTASYLNRSVNNAVIDHLRAERVRHAFIAGTRPEQYVAQPPSPLDVVEARDEVKRVDTVIRDLPEKTRHIFLLNKIHGRNYAEIAKALGISRSAVEKHIARAIVACKLGR